MRIMIDSCFWIALYNPEKHPEKIHEVEAIAELIEDYEIIIPFPSLYEFLNSRFSRKNDAYHFKKLISRSNYIKLDDTPFKEKAFENFFYKAMNDYQDVSLVDEIMKEIIDSDIKIDYIITFDEVLKNYALSKGVKSP